MKFILVTIRRGVHPKPKMRYPDIFNTQEVTRLMVGPIVYEGRLPLGEATSKCLMKVPDDLARRYAEHDDIEIVDATGADAWLAQNPQLKARPQEEVQDVNRLTAIIAKKLAGVTLSREDEDALDPDSHVRGINKVARTCKDIFPSTE